MARGNKVFAAILGSLMLAAGGTVALYSNLSKDVSPLTIQVIHERLPVCILARTREHSCRDDITDNRTPKTDWGKAAIFGENSITLDTESEFSHLELKWDGGSTAGLEFTDNIKNYSYHVLQRYNLEWSEERKDWEIVGVTLLWVNGNELSAFEQIFGRNHTWDKPYQLVKKAP